MGNWKVPLEDPPPKTTNDGFSTRTFLQPPPKAWGQTKRLEKSRSEARAWCCPVSAASRSRPSPAVETSGHRSLPREEPKHGLGSKLEPLGIGPLESLFPFTRFRFQFGHPFLTHSQIALGNKGNLEFSGACHGFLRCAWFTATIFGWHPPALRS